MQTTTDASQLPNQSVTWGRDIVSFDAWLAGSESLYASRAAALVGYLQAQIIAASPELVGREFHHAALGVVAHLSLHNNRAQELLYAYLALTVGGDPEPANKLIAGHRLNPNLHPEYVQATRCYG